MAVWKLSWIGGQTDKPALMERRERLLQLVKISMRLACNNPNASEEVR